MKELSEVWDYPAGPAGTSNVFSSDPGYDEASGPRNPTGDRFIPIDQVADDEGIWFDDWPDDLDESDGPVLDEEPTPVTFQPYAVTAWDWWFAFITIPVVETTVPGKVFDPKTRRWRKTVLHLPTTH